MSDPRRMGGRPRQSADGALRSAVIRMRCTPAEFDKFQLLGGVEWLRKVLKRARVAQPPAELLLDVQLVNDPSPDDADRT